MISHASSAEALTYTPKELADALKVSVRTLRRLDAAGRLPLPTKIGRSLRWRCTEIEAWLAAGGPKRREWIAMRRPR